jgi:hypothetical protein
VDIVGIGEMDGVVEVGVDGDAIGKRQAVPQESPSGSEFDDQQSDYYRDYYPENPLHVADEYFGNVPLGFEENVRLQGEIEHRQKKRQGDELLDPQAENPGIPGIFELRTFGGFLDRDDGLFDCGLCHGRYI